MTILKHIQGDWPENLESWDIYRDRLKVAANGEHYLWNDAVGDIPEPVSAILLALEHDTVNTAALYKLLITPLDVEWKEKQTVNADRTKWPPRFSSVWRRDLACPSARWGLLDRRTLTAVLRLREEFHVKVGRLVNIVHSHFANGLPSQNCRHSDPARCRETYAAFTRVLWQQVYTGWTGHTDVLDVFSVGKLMKDWNDRIICPPCMADAINPVRAYRYDIWDDLGLLWKKYLRNL